MNKKFFLLTVLLIAYLTGKSQLEKNNWMVGGSASYSHTIYNAQIFSPGYEEYEFMISPEIGYFLADKFAAGIIASLNEAGSRPQEGGGVWNKFSNLNFGPFIRYYFLKKESLVNILTQSYYQFGAVGSTSGLNRNTLAFSVGSVLYFNSTVGLELMISQLNYRYKNVDGIDKKLLFSLGLQVHLQKDN